MLTALIVVSLSCSCCGSLQPKQLLHTVSFSSIFFTKNNLNLQVEPAVGAALLAWNFLMKESERHHNS